MSSEDVYKRQGQDKPTQDMALYTRVILKEGGSIHDIYANTFLKKDHLGYVEVKSDGTFGMA